MSSVTQDLRHTARALARAPGFTAVVALTLALGIGGTTAVFSVLRVSLFAGLPYPVAGRIVALDLVQANGDEVMESWSFPKYQTMLANVTTLELVTARRGAEVILAGGAEPVRAYQEATTPAYFALFGARAALGRLFLPTDDAPGAPLVAVLPDHIWRRLFGADPGIIGRSVRVNGMPVEIVGVANSDFKGISGRVDLWVPIQALPALGYARLLERRWAHSFVVFGRLKPGVTLERAQAELAVVGGVVDAAHPEPGDSKARWTATAVPVARGQANAELRDVFTILAGAVLLVLLLACVNVANMLLARAAARERELVIRAALGAGRGRLTRHLLAESVLLAAIGGALGLALAAWGVDLLRTVVPITTGGHGMLYFSPESLRLDGWVAAFAAAIALGAGITVGVVPAWRFARPESSAALREGAGSARGLGSLRRPTLRGSLAAIQVALAVVLLAGAGLMLRTLANLAAVNPGFDPGGVLALSYRLPPTDARANDPAFHAQILERFAAVPGVRAAALAACPPLSGCYDFNSVTRIDGGPRIPDDAQSMIRTQQVSETFFATMGIPVIAGRGFDAGDRAGAEPVIVINQTAAHEFFPGTSPLGHGLAVSNGLTRGDTTARIIGVVPDVRHQTLHEKATPEVYVSLRQLPTSSPAVFLRVPGDPLAVAPSVRAALAEIAPEAPIHHMTTMPDVIKASTTGERLVGWSLAAFAALALALAALGVYGVVAFSVTQRRREVAVRMALGAEPARVLGMILRESMGLVGAGALVGLVAALLLGRALASQLYGVAPRDPVTLVTIIALLASVAGLATLLPARRATKADPMTALRSD
jgi:predicted permease